MKSARARTAYDVAHHYDAGYFQDLAQRYRRRNRFARQRIANVLSLLPPLAGRTLIDLGCGMGTFTVEAARRGALTVGVDPSAEAVRTARRVLEEEDARTARLLRADAAALPIASATAHVVLAADLTEHLDEQTLASVLVEAARVLRTGGRLVLYTPERAHVFERLRDHQILLPPDPSHIGIRSANALRAAVERAGFVVERLVFLPSHLPGWNLLERSLQRWVPALRRRIGLVAARS